MGATWHGHDFTVIAHDEKGTGSSCSKCGHRIAGASPPDAPQGGAVFRRDISYICLTVIDDLEKLPSQYRSAVPFCLRPLSPDADHRTGHPT